MAARPSLLAEEPGLAACDPEAGLFGPASMMWAVGRESLCFFGAGAALLLQTAHPWIAQGVSDHSRALTDPLGRFHRTFRPVFSIIYGTRTQALAQAGRVAMIHARITGILPEAIGPFPKGSSYAANDPDALFWVHATLWHTAMAVGARVLGPLPGDARDRYHAETKRFAALFGIPQDRLQADWAGFAARFEEIAASDTLSVGEAGRRIGGYFLGSGHGGLGRLVPGWYRQLTASLLPPRVALAFGLAVPSPQDADRLWQNVARSYRKLPGVLRHIGPYQEACARLDGRRPGPWITTLNRLWLGRPRLEPLA